MSTNSGYCWAEQDNVETHLIISYIENPMIRKSKTVLETKLQSNCCGKIQNSAGDKLQSNVVGSVINNKMLSQEVNCQGARSLSLTVTLQHFR